MAWFKETRSRLIIFLLAVVSLGIITYILINRETSQWDFRTYYYAARIDIQGDDPYDNGLLNQAAGVEQAHPFLYPPITLWLFRLFASFSYVTASYLWLAFKVALLAWLIYVWRRHFLREETGWMVYLFLMVAFGSPISYDLRAGNVSIVEQTLIWSGFFFLKDNRPAPFCLLILAASIFKWTPIVFLLLLLILKVERRWLYLAGSALGFLLTLAVNYFSDPQRFVRFASAAMARDERGVDANPSILSLIKDGTEFTARFGVPDGVIHVLPYAIYLLVVGAVLLFTVRCFGFSGSSNAKRHVILTIYMTCLMYALVMPRFKTYSFILLLPVAFYIIRNCYSRGAFPLLFILVAFSADPSLPGQLFMGRLSWYYPLLTAYGLWVLWLWSMKGRLLTDDSPLPE